MNWCKIDEIQQNLKNASCHFTCEVLPSKKTETNRIQSILPAFVSFFSDGTSAANYYKKPKITLYKTKVKFIWNSDIHLKAGKLVCVLPYIGAHIDAAINGATRRITDDNLHSMLAIIARNWTVILRASKTWFLLAACYSISRLYPLL